MTLTRHVLAVCLATLLFIAGSATPSAASKLALAPGDKAPEIRAKTSDGEYFYAPFEGKKITVVNFWATWCEPCKDEMPALQLLHAKYENVGLQVIGVLHDKVTLQTMQQFADELGVEYPVVRFRGKFGQKWGGAAVLPLTYLIDSEGVILRRYVGATPEQIEGLITDVEAVLVDKPLGSMVLPEKPAVATEEDRRRAIKKP